MAECVDYSFKVPEKKKIRRYKGIKRWEHYVMNSFIVYGVLSVFTTI